MIKSCVRHSTYWSRSGNRSFFTTLQLSLFLVFALATLVYSAFDILTLTNAGWNKSSDFCLALAVDLCSGYRFFSFKSRFHYDKGSYDHRAGCKFKSSCTPIFLYVFSADPQHLFLLIYTYLYIYIYIYMYKKKETLGVSGQYIKKNWRAAGLELTTSAPSRTIVTDGNY